MLSAGGKKDMACFESLGVVAFIHQQMALTVLIIVPLKIVFILFNTF